MGARPDRGAGPLPVAHTSLFHKLGQFGLFDLLDFWLVNYESFYMERNN